jgi:hypothetical protein
MTQRTLSGALLVAIAGVVFAAAVAVAAQDRPLPERGVFLQETRKRLQTDDSVQSGYAYVETRRASTLDSKGRTTSQSVRVIESYPGLPGEEGRWERVIAIDGRPVPAKELADQDRERQRKAQTIAQQLAAQPASERARQARDLEEQRREREAAVADIFAVYDIKMLGRESVEGHDTIAFSLTPRPSAHPRTREGRIMRRFAVRAWISESDHELVRLDAEAIETVSFGLGLLARVHKGTRATFQRRKVNGEAWLPAVTSYTASARVALVRMLRRSGVSEYSAYRKFAVDATATYGTPTAPAR